MYLKVSTLNLTADWAQGSFERQVVQAQIAIHLGDRIVLTNSLTGFAWGTWLFLFSCLHGLLLWGLPERIRQDKAGG